MVLKSEEIRKLGEKDMEKKIKTLKMELVKAQTSKGKNSKIKEIKRTIARIKTIQK